MKKLILLSIIALSLLNCNDAHIASRNISEASDNFEIIRRVIFYNGITDKYIMTIEGKCSINPRSRVIDVICKTGVGAYKKHYLGLSDNVTYFIEQLESKEVSANHYRVVFKPQAIIPDIDFKGSLSDTPRNQR
jgi:hypothetical protein